MTREHWLRYSWNLSGRSFDSGLEKNKYVIRTALKKEKDVVGRVVESSFFLDSDWGKYSKTINEKMLVNLEKAFSGKEPTCIALLHGTRIVGVSLFDLSEEVESHLATGPCVLIEYRSRGFGTKLLAESLAYLQSEGLEKAYGVTPADSVAAKFVYPKFDGSPEPYKLEEEAES